MHALLDDCGAAAPRRLEFTARDGSKRVLGLTSAAMPPGRLDPNAGEVVILDDSSEYEALLRAVGTKNKMAAIGTLSAGLAHEIRNPLNAVVGFASLLVRDQPEGSKQKHWCEQILAGALETNRILTGLVDFARPGELSQEPIDALELLEEARSMVLEHLPADSAHTIELEVECRQLHGDRLKLRQALRNLIQNACDATPHGGRVLVRSSATAKDIVLSVEDDGPGVPEARREQLFEPFYTSRAAGTGLGLALTHAIAELHGGLLRYSNVPSRMGGAHFELLLPLA